MIKRKIILFLNIEIGKVNSHKKSESDARWKVCTYGVDRYKYDKNSKSHKKTDITKELKCLFDKYEIKYETGECVKNQISNQENASFFKELISLLNLTLQLRHINPDAELIDDKDFILSPVADESGRFFDSRKAKENEPKNADANGAYHIALKGLETIKNIESKKDKLQLPNIKNKDWFKYIRSHSHLLKHKKAS